MPKRLWTAAIAVAALGAAAAWWGATSRPGEQARAQAALPASEPRVVAQAQIVAIDGIIEVRPLMEGKVLRVLVQPGDRVAANQLLAEIESGIPKAAVDQREAEMRAKAGIAGGRPAEVRAAGEQLAAASAALDQGKIVLSRTKIVAPVGGIIMTRSVNPGDILGSNAIAPTLFRLVNPERIEVRLELEELLASRVAIGLPVTFVLPGGKVAVGRGKVTRIAPQVEKRTIGADDARVRADSMVRPAWSDFTPADRGDAFPVNFRLEAWVRPFAASLRHSTD
ncbi:MAG: hypothetical protein AUG75_08200 [Cyanobacteria bacterium 13_1_20CM_4_61_6]|nr:MAG: hypothetical protein AUG75_08200 [Cyanobacteria bacterium 13_1_20CM_4_61_6]